MKNKDRVSVLGLGWLGLPLAHDLLGEGFEVKGSVTSQAKLDSLNPSKIESSIIRVFEDRIDLSDSDFFDTDILVINFPPRRIEQIETIYPLQMQQLLPLMVKKNLKRVIFVSSTSVYPEVCRDVFEDEVCPPEKPSGVACLNAENVFRNHTHLDTTVVRFGGLIGADRGPHRFMKRKQMNGAGDKPVNLIHQDDCIGIIKHIITDSIWNETFNACCPVHPSRREFYTKAAEVAGVECPVFEDVDAFQFKTVNSNKILSKFGYTFKHNSPLDCLNMC